MQYTKKFFSSKNWKLDWKKFVINIFAQNIDCGYTLEPSSLGSSNEYPQSMFRIKMRKIGIPWQTPFSLYMYISGVSGVIFIARTFYPDECER